MRRPDGHPLLALGLDLVMAPMAHLRPPLLAEARGDVLELGVGTGVNLAHYLPGQVRSVTAIEPDPHMIRKAGPRAEAAAVPVHIRRLSAEALPFDDASFDTVVATWVFCTIPDASAAAFEAWRVLRPGGRLLFVEHVAAEHPPMRAVQGLLDPAWQRVAGGCHLTRDPVQTFREAGFVIDELRSFGPTRWNLVPQLGGAGSKVDPPSGTPRDQAR